MATLILALVDFAGLHHPIQLLIMINCKLVVEWGTLQKLYQDYKKIQNIIFAPMQQMKLEPDIVMS